MRQGGYGANSDIRHVAARFEKPDELLARKCRANQRMETIVAAIEQLFCDLRLACIRLFGSTEIREVETSQLGSRLERWAASREDLSKWIAYAARVKQARKLGLGEVTDYLSRTSLRRRTHWQHWTGAYYAAVLLTIASDDPELARLDGEAPPGTGR